MYFFLKVVLSALVIAGISELGKRSSLFAALLASLPLTSVLALVWLYLDTRDTSAVMALSSSIFWMVLPSLLFFIALPVLLRLGLGFSAALLSACLITAGVYALYTRLLGHVGIYV